MRSNLEKPDDSEVNILRTYENPTSQNLCGASYMIPEPNGLELKRGDAVIFKVPEELLSDLDESADSIGNTLDNVTIHHRKDPSRAPAEKGWDKEGSYTRTMVYDLNTRAWIILGRDKFAEVRNPGRYETENIPDCIDFGKIKPGYFAVIGTGIGKRGVVNFHGLEFSVFPENTKPLKEVIFTPGTEFVDLEKGIYHPSYGGGVWPDKMGIYEDSVPLNHPNISNIGFNVTLSGEDFYVENTGVNTGRMHIRIKEDMLVKMVEVAAGDTEDWKGEVYKVRPDGPERFRRGWALLSVYAQKKDGSIITFLDDMNVPPRGILKGSPPEALNLEEGDEIIIESRNDATYVMGFKIQ